MSKLRTETVTEVHHWNDSLFSIKTTRDDGLRFRNGEFAMIGIVVDGRPLLRAYSIASPNYEDHLEFFSIKVPDGPLTSRLQHIIPVHSHSDLSNLRKDLSNLHLHVQDVR